MTKETLLAQTFVKLADTLVDEFDVVDMLTTLANRCVEVLDVSAAGLMLVAPGGELRILHEETARLSDQRPQERLRRWRRGQARRERRG